MLMAIRFSLLGKRKTMRLCIVYSCFYFGVYVTMLCYPGWTLVFGLKTRRVRITIMMPSQEAQ